MQVRLSRGFWIGKDPVTQAQWQAVMGGNPSRFKGANLPVESVNWNDSQEFLQRLAVPGAGWRWMLPTEAQWEYACRIGTGNPFWWWSKYNRCGEKQGGLCENSGTVWEWCADWWGDALLGGMDPGGPPSGSARVIRGGGWHYSGLYCRCPHHNGSSPGNRHNDLGFRLAAVPTA